MRQIKIIRTIKYIGEDILILIQGGKHHIGCCVIGEPYLKDNQWHTTISTWNRLSHKDDEIAKLYVSSACLSTQKMVTCICGIHLDDIKVEELKKIMDWCKKDIKTMEKEFKDEN